MFNLRPSPRLKPRPAPLPLERPSPSSDPLPSPMVRVVLSSYDSYASSWNGSSDALTDWLNARWEKTGFRVSREVVCFTLRTHGRRAEMGMGDLWGGVMWRGAGCCV
ncbi:amidase signature enzyme [Teratosphaeria destructans]|uniref:Amidase signature enzyme n=1 Tax=Teratosphaeria destructans TaxID=418781 RepID=A0A9W7W0K7_9PEZI|nr:amidase signature enzyme [Teratosphaeria destructans]